MGHTMFSVSVVQFVRGKLTAAGSEATFVSGLRPLGPGSVVWALSWLLAWITGFKVCGSWLRDWSVVSVFWLRIAASAQDGIEA